MSLLNTILIIDDNITNLKIASEHLKAQAFEVLTARDGESGIERAKFAKPDLILLDVQMPGIDGYETCRRLKNFEQTKSIPVIFTSVLNNVEDKLKGFAAGGVDYVSKPFQIEELLARVTTHLTIYRLQRDLHLEIHERKMVEAALRKANLELQRLAVLDGLTQIANRRRFDQYLQDQWEQSKNNPLSLLMCDVDYFKLYNDGYGHPAGDSCLKCVAQAISRVVGHPKDLVARYGGEEFAIILPETDLQGALQVANIIQTEINNLQLEHAHTKVKNCQHVSLSIGVASLIPDASGQAADLLAIADAALYQAKQQGRKQVAVART